MIRNLVGALFALLPFVAAFAQGVDGAETLWLEKAEIVVRYQSESSRKIEQRVGVSSETPVQELRIEHSLFLEDDESIRNLSVSSEDGIAGVNLEGRGLSTVLWVTIHPTGDVEAAEVSYFLELELEVGDSKRCPLSVPKLVPRDPHNPVQIEVKLPSGTVLSGMVFPKLEWIGDRLVGGMGGVPSFLSVPHGQKKQSWLARNAVDGSILIFIIISTALWLRSRKRVDVEPSEEH
jgi:hypothetical protein